MEEVIAFMLILTRRPLESIRIGPRIRVTVLGFKGNQVRIGIEAPPDVAVDREEIRLARGSMPTLHEKARIP